MSDKANKAKATATPSVLARMQDDSAAYHDGALSSLSTVSACVLTLEIHFMKECVSQLEVSPYGDFVPSEELNRLYQVGDREVGYGFILIQGTQFCSL